MNYVIVIIRSNSNCSSICCILKIPKILPYIPISAFINFSSFGNVASFYIIIIDEPCEIFGTSKTSRHSPERFCASSWTNHDFTHIEKSLVRYTRVAFTVKNLITSCVEFFRSNEWNNKLFHSLKTVITS